MFTNSQENTRGNTKTLPNFLVRKFHGKAEFLQIFRRSNEIFALKKLVKIMVFYAVNDLQLSNVRPTILLNTVNASS